MFSSDGKIPRPIPNTLTANSTWEFREFDWVKLLGKFKSYRTNQEGITIVAVPDDAAL